MGVIRVTGFPPGPDLFPRLHLPHRLVEHGLGWLERAGRAVRIHTDEGASRLAGALRADAVTLGREIFFQSGRFDPTTPRGLALLSHELTHVWQQDQGGRPFRQGEDARSPEGLEREAIAVERSVYRILTAADPGSPSPHPILLNADRSVSMQFALPSPSHQSSGGGSSTASSHGAALASATLPMRAPEGREVEPGGPGEASPGDAAEVAAQVYRLLERRLRIDRERLGLGNIGRG